MQNGLRIILLFDVNQSYFDDYVRKTILSLYIFVPSDLDQWLFDFKIAAPAPVTRVKGNISSKFVVLALQFRVNQRHRTDRRTVEVQRLMRLISYSDFCREVTLLCYKSLSSSYDEGWLLFVAWNKAISMLISVDSVLWQAPCVIRFSSLSSQVRCCVG